MNSSYPAELYKHLEKQNQLLMEAKRTISHELHRLKVEEEMMMRKFYELMAARKQAKKNKKEENVSDEGGEDASIKVENGESSALVCYPSDER